MAIVLDFVTMKLKQIDTNLPQNRFDPITRGIHEQPYHGHEWRQSLNDPPGLRH